MDATLITGHCGPATNSSHGTRFSNNPPKLKKRELLMTPETRPNHTLPLLLHIATTITGLIDAVSYLALGHVFTANLTGNVVFLAFAVAGAPGLSIPRSAVSLCAFLAGAVAGGRLAARLGSGPQRRWVATAFGAEAVLLLCAALAAAVGRGAAHYALYAVIVLTALAMGVRNATVRKIAL